MKAVEVCMPLLVKISEMGMADTVAFDLFTKSGPWQHLTSISEGADDPP
jgi:hypothetical protein